MQYTKNLKLKQCIDSKITKKVFNTRLMIHSFGILIIILKSQYNVCLIVIILMETEW